MLVNENGYSIQIHAVTNGGKFSINKDSNDSNDSASHIVTERKESPIKCNANRYAARVPPSSFSVVLDVSTHDFLPFSCCGSESSNGSPNSSEAPCQPLLPLNNLSRTYSN